MAAGNHINSFKFAQGNVYYSTTAPTFVESTAISANAVITTSNQVIGMKNITITPPKGEVEVINLLGEEAVSTVGSGVPVSGSFQNQVHDEKAWTDATITGTIIWTAHNDGSNAALIPDFLNLATGVASAVGTTYHRHAFGDSTSGQTRNTAGCVFIIMNNGVEECTIAANAPYVNFGEIKPTGDDGYYEADVEIKALAKNFVIEVKDFD